ncbi:MAG: RNA polymerase-binding protein DksA [Deltaproteobacteria bacterium]|nr:RNA polymerase-binding protein DksA [Deltaproteobacteria bacterium]
MKKSELRYFREVLNNWQAQLLRQADHAIVGLLGASVNSSDLIDQAALETDRDFALRMRDRESKLIRKIRNALKRIDEGTFGICEMCGEPIALKRLKARPVTTHCIDCKRVRETLERVLGE